MYRMSCRYHNVEPGWIHVHKICLKCERCSVCVLHASLVRGNSSLVK